jgi:hypothetical protein
MRSWPEPGSSARCKAPQDADEWVSAELAARYRLLGEPRTGSVLVLYTYDGNAYDPGSIIRIELRPAAIPEP